jgi:hypothetical protein
MLGSMQVVLPVQAAQAVSRTSQHQAMRGVGESPVRSWRAVMEPHDEDWDTVRLINGLFLSEGPSLYLVFLGQSSAAIDLEEVLVELDRPVVHIPMTHDADANARINDLVIPRAPKTLLWLDLLLPFSQKATSPEERGAFAWMFARMNGNRDRVLNGSGCPLVIAGPWWLMRSVRAWAPELWAVRQGEFLLGTNFLADDFDEAGLWHSSWTSLASVS